MRPIQNARTCGCTTYQDGGEERCRAHEPTTIDTITNKQIETLRTEAGTHGDMEQVALCDRALSPRVGDRVIWDVGPTDDHDTGRVASVATLQNGFAAEIAWDSQITTSQWWAVVPTEAARACVEAIREAEIA
jgi:hypothetical protein